MIKKPKIKPYRKYKYNKGGNPPPFLNFLL